MYAKKIQNDRRQRAGKLQDRCIKGIKQGQKNKIRQKLKHRWQTEEAKLGGSIKIRKDKKEEKKSSRRDRQNEKYDSQELLQKQYACVGVWLSITR
jgi:hypothetical protein